MTPLERAARALCRLDGHPENAMMEGRPLWQDYLPEARAVLTAIRQPSEGMIAEGNERMDVDPEQGHHEATPEGIWSVMIDAALTEEP